MVVCLTTATIITVAKVGITIGSTLVTLSPFVERAMEKRKGKKRR